MTTATQLQRFNNHIQHEVKDPTEMKILHVETEYIIYQNVDSLFKYTFRNGENRTVLNLPRGTIITTLTMYDTYCILHNFSNGRVLICCDTTHVPWTKITLRDVNYNLVNGLDDNNDMHEYTSDHNLLFFRKTRRLIEFNRTSLTNRLFLIDFTTSQILQRYIVPEGPHFLALNPDETKCVMICIRSVHILDFTTNQMTFLFDIHDMKYIRPRYYLPDIYWDINDNISFYYNGREVLIYNLQHKTTVKYNVDGMSIHDLNQKYVAFMANKPTSTYQGNGVMYTGGLYQIKIFENIKQQMYTVYTVDNIDIYLPDETEGINTTSWLLPHALFYTPIHELDVLHMIKIPKISHGVANQLKAIRYKLAARQVDLKNLFEPFMTKIINMKTFDDRYKIERQILQHNTSHIKDYYTKHNLPLPSAEQMEKYNNAIKHKYIKLIKQYHPNFLQTPEVASLSKFDKRESHRAEYTALRDALLKEMADIEIKMLKLQEKRTIAFKQLQKNENAETNAKFTRINNRFFNTITKYTEYLAQKLKATDYDSNKKLYASIKGKITAMITYLAELQNEHIQHDISSSRSMSSLSSSK